MKRGDFFFKKKCFRTLKPARGISPKCFEKKSLSDELFLLFYEKGQNLTVFSFINMIRIRFFGPEESIQNGFPHACYAWRKGRERIEQTGSLFPSGQLKTNRFVSKANDQRNRARVVLDLFSNLKKGKIQWLLSVNLWVT